MQIHLADSEWILISFWWRWAFYIVIDESRCPCPRLMRMLMSLKIYYLMNLSQFLYVNCGLWICAPIVRSVCVCVCGIFSHVFDVPLLDSFSDMINLFRVWMWKIKCLTRSSFIAHRSSFLICKWDFYGCFMFLVIFESVRTYNRRPFLFKWKKSNRTSLLRFVSFSRGFGVTLSLGSLIHCAGTTTGNF